MESGDLRIFQAVAREGSITKAAQALNYVQSNVTNRVQQLEAELEIQLFYRTNRGMKLTASGQNLLEYADKILYLLDEAVKSTQHAEHPAGPLRLGALETTSAIHLPQLMAGYHKKFPEVKLSLITGDTHALLQKVLHYELDGAFIYGPLAHPDIEQFTAFEEELVLVSEPCESNLKELLARPLLFFGAGCSHRARTERLLLEEGITPNHIMEFGTLESILGGVSAGLGVSLLPKSLVAGRESTGEICSYRLPEPYREVNVLFVYRRDLFMTNAFRTFIDFMKAPGSST
ncbi:LysR family transcriptional regulator [Paenibacillus apiarius]|uniref:LysR family transcriptional regulator n=1 Tax=Paenibacillus apiarius TaxID=46240 RepID=UPI00197CC329|nr:LysR family transcriptional regulator [Paenibacillus apiarius]MBN3525222.1 LysR family transcriptional regulator [Paenibacillus apiarius]